jgi:hypothetical protein
MGDSGIDRPGNDLPGMPVPTQNATTCEELCNFTPDCAAWVVSSCGISECWLKNPVPPISPSNCRVSGIKGTHLNHY